MRRRQQKRAALFVNARARSGRDDLTDLVAALRREGIDVQDRSPNNLGDLDRAIRQAGIGHDFILIGGGDGTISRSLGALLAADRPVGIVPMGTANDLARTLGVSDDRAHIADVVARGVTRRIDVSKVNDIYFVNVAGIGIGATAAEALTDRLKKTWGPLAYAISAFRARDAARPFRCELHFDGVRKRMRCVQILVGNGRHYGSGMTISDEARLDTGHLEVYALAPPRPLDLPGLFLALRWGKLKRWQGAFRGQIDSVAITTKRPMPVNTDGEVLTETPARFTMSAGALEVFVPQADGPGLAVENGDAANR